MGRVRWTPERDRELVRDYGKVPTRELAERFGTTPGAVESHAWAIGATRARLKWTDERVATLRATYPILGRECGPLCGCSRDAAAVKAKKLGVYLHVRKRPEPDRERRKVALMVARWCVGHGMHAQTVVEECAEWCGCTPAMMRMVLPRLLKDEVKRKKSKKEQEGEGQCST